MAGEHLTNDEQTLIQELLLRVEVLEKALALLNDDFRYYETYRMKRRKE